MNLAKDLIMDQSHEPTMEEIVLYFRAGPRKMWQEIIEFIETGLKGKQQSGYSVCKEKPGWNVKYKKGGKALCTLYPGKDSFTALVVLGRKERAVFDETREEYCKYIRELYDGSRLFNGTKWLMVEVTDDIVLENLKSLIMLKLKK